MGFNTHEILKSRQRLTRTASGATGLREGGEFIGVRFFEGGVQKTGVFLTGVIRDFLSGEFAEK